MDATSAGAGASCRSGEARPACVYKPRRPQASPLFRLVADHFTAFHAAYEERFAPVYGDRRPVVREFAEKFLECGILENEIPDAPTPSGACE